MNTANSLLPYVVCTACRRTFAVALLLALPIAPAQAQEPPRAKAQAPDNHVILKRTVSGGYFVAKPLKEEYDRALSRLRLVKADIDSARTTGAQALKELTELQSSLESLRQQIEAQKVFVPIAQTHTETQTVNFDLGQERCLLITAEDVRVVGWDQPGVKCELERTVLSADGKRDDAELAAIKLVHRHGREPQKVGRTLVETEADEQRFLASEAGQRLTPAERDNRHQRALDIFLSWAHLSDFQGKEIDTVEVEGLTHDQGNRQIGMEIGYAGGRTVGSEWRRHAKLTVYVPVCNFVAICGGGTHNLACMDVQNVQASLVLSSNGTHKTADSEPFQVRNLTGSLLVRQVPLDIIDGVMGNVNIVGTVELSGTSTRHSGGAVVGMREPALACSGKNVIGDFVAWFQRVDLQLEKIGGRIDVRNEFGDTKLQVDGAPSPAAHRIISESGRIEMSLARRAWGEFPLWALTQCGTFRSTTPQDFLQEFNFGTADADGTRRSWVGLRRSRDRENFDPRDFLNSAARPGLALRGADRAPGFDLISRGGSVVILTTP